MIPEEIPENILMREMKNYINENICQGHICINNNVLFPDSVDNGIYGFPHSGGIGTKSYWRAVASLYNIGSNDLVFFHRTSGSNPGCKEIHGPFKITNIEGEPGIFYDRTNKYPILIGNETKCTARFLFEPMFPNFYSISDNYELIKKFETKHIWGLRHPSVMNIGAAQKKSIAAITVNQNLEFIDMLYSPSYGTRRGLFDGNLSPSPEVLDYYRNSVENPDEGDSFPLNDSFLENAVAECDANVPDEAMLYCYILRGLKCPGSRLREQLLADLVDVNENFNEQIFVPLTDLFTTNGVLELVPSSHLQETVDIMLADKNEATLLLMEFKKDSVTQNAIDQSGRYIDLFEGIFQDKTVLVNVIGHESDPDLEVPERFRNKIEIVEYNIEGNRIRFSNPA